MPMTRVHDPEPDFGSDEWHEDEYGSSKLAYEGEHDDCPIDVPHEHEIPYDQPAPACEWFAGCGRPATGTTSHPVLGDVPTCDDCARFAAPDDWPNEEEPWI